jgi:hypothetical protein
VEPEEGALPVSMDELEKVEAIVAGGVAAEALEDVVRPEEESAAKRLVDAVSGEAVDRADYPVGAGCGDGRASQV